MYIWIQPFLNIFKINLGQWRILTKHDIKDSTSNNFLGFRNYPHITLCPYPSYDLKIITTLGYHNAFDYSLGKSIDKRIVGWNSFGSMTNSTRFIIRNVSTIKSVRECPWSRVVWIDNKGLTIYEKLEMKLTSPFYPKGTCCQAVVPKNSKKYVLR